MTRQELSLQRRLVRAHRAGALACQVPGCRAVINGWTGLQQLDRLRQHYRRAHLSTLGMDEALGLRERMEASQAAASVSAAPPRGATPA